MHRSVSVRTLIDKFSAELSKLTHGLAWVYFCLEKKKINKDDSVETQKHFHDNHKSNQKFQRYNKKKHI
jgi:hypothetical protein